MEKKPKTDIYNILGIDPNHKSTRSDANYRMKYRDSSHIDNSIVNDPNAPSGNILDNYSKYPAEQYVYWRYFRILTITGIAFVLIIVGHNIMKDISFSFPSSSPKVETEELSAYDYSAPEEIEAPTVKPYGPFQDRYEIIQFLKDHFSAGGYETSFDIAETIVTDFGSKKTFSKSEYAERTRTHNERHGIIGYSHNVDENSVSTTLTEDGGIEVSFVQIYDMITRDDWGDERTTQYECKSKFGINKDKKIDYIWERSKKIDQW